MIPSTSVDVEAINSSTVFLCSCMFCVSSFHVIILAVPLWALKPQIHTVPKLSINVKIHGLDVFSCWPRDKWRYDGADDFSVRPKTLAKSFKEKAPPTRSLRRFYIDDIVLMRLFAPRISRCRLWFTVLSGIKAPYRIALRAILRTIPR